MKKAIDNSIIIILILCIIIFSINIAYIFKQTHRVTPSANINNNSKTIILDAGHGGEDGGTIGLNNIIEKDLNLEITLKLQKTLELMGYEIILTRDSDVSIHDYNANTIREKKKSDLNNRLKLIESTPNCILISIHQNYFEQSKYKGLQVFYSINNAESKIIADTIQNKIKTGLQPDNKRIAKKLGAQSYIMANTNVPAVLIECGFLSNSIDVQNLTDEEYQKKLVYTISSSIVDYFKGDIYNNN